MKRWIILLVQLPVRLYSYALSPLLGQSCRFYPSCSAYMLEAIEKHGAFKGAALGLKRIGKCHPWCRAEWYDPVPPSCCSKQKGSVS